MTENAERIAAEILAQKDKDGVLRVPAIYAFAVANRDSEIARRLEWDDEKCGINWRHHQIRQLIAIYVVNDDGYRDTISLVVDRKKDGGGYRSVPEVFSNRDMREAALSQALAELDRVQDLYGYLDELAAIFAEKDKVKKRAGRKRPRAESSEGVRPTA
jgi:hypothetical protein